MHMYIEAKDTKNKLPLLLVGFSEEDLENLLKLVKEKGGGFSSVDASKHAQIDLGIMVRKTDEDIATRIELMMQDVNAELIAIWDEDDK